MRRAVIVAFLALGLILLGTPDASADRATRLAKKASKVEPETCENVQTVDDCHENYPTGCTKAQKHKYDAFLNFVKNQTPKPTSKPLKTLTEQDFKTLEDQLPDGLKKGSNGEYAQELAKLGQGNIYALIGYLYSMQVTGAESTNCQLDDKAQEQTDYHIHIGFDQTVAQSLREGASVAEQKVKPTSIVVEMTPHYRAWHQPKWTSELVKRFLGRQVKVMGQLLADTEHAIAKDNCAHPHAVKDKCWRASIWEIHPVIEFYVCDNEALCAANSPQWRKIVDMP